MISLYCLTTNVEIKKVDNSYFLDIKNSSNSTITLSLNEEILTVIYEKIEQALWHESEHSNVLRDRVETLEARVEELQEKLEEAEISYREVPYYDYD